MTGPRWFCLFWLMLLAVLLAGCGVVSDPPTPTPLPSPTQPPPTETPIPPTDTPAPTDTPVPTVTPAPPQSIDVIVNLLKPVVEGIGVPEAAEYDPNRLGIHPLIFISPIDQGVYDISLPKTWIPQNIGQAELVAALRFNEILLETKLFTFLKEQGGGRHWVGRYRIDTEVSLREARKGTLIASTTFPGNDPPPFQGIWHLATSILKGAATSSDVIQIWLQPFVEK